MVDRLGESRLEDLSLEATLEEILNLESEDVIETHAGLVENTDSYKTTDQGVTLCVQIVEVKNIVSSSNEGQFS